MAAEKLIKTDQNEFISQMYCYVVKANTRLWAVTLNGVVQSSGLPLIIIGRHSLGRGSIIFQISEIKIKFEALIYVYISCRISLCNIGYVESLIMNNIKTHYTKV